MADSVANTAERRVHRRSTANCGEGKVLVTLVVRLISNPRPAWYKTTAVIYPPADELNLPARLFGKFDPMD